MKAIKFWSFLFFLCLGFAFSSCDGEGEDVDSGESPVDEYVNPDGVASGKQLYDIERHAQNDKALIVKGYIF